MDGKPFKEVYVYSHPQGLSGNLYLFCDKVCGFTVGQKRHMGVYKNQMNSTTIHIHLPYMQKNRRVAGFLSHL